MTRDAKGGKQALDAWRAAADRLEDRLEHVSDSDIDTREALSWELVALYRDPLRQPGRVVTTLAALEKILDGGVEAPRLLRVVEAQQEQLEAMKRWPEVIGRIRRRVELTDDPQQRKALNLQAGNLFIDKFNNQAEAIECYEQVLEDGLDAEAIAKLVDLYGRRLSWEKLLVVQQEALALIADPQEREAQRLELARGAAGKTRADMIHARLVLAVVGFVGHTPGLKLFARCRFTPRLVRVNITAAVLTLAAMAGAYALADAGERAWSLFLAWLVGHFLWSGILATWILRGGAIAAASPPATGSAHGSTRTPRQNAM